MHSLLHKAAELGMDDLCRWLGRRHGELEVRGSRRAEERGRTRGPNPLGMQEAREAQ